MKVFNFPINLVLLALVLFTGTFSKFPTSKCHCNDAAKKASTFCPFGELRSIASSTDLVLELDLSFDRLLRQIADPSLNFPRVSFKLSELPTARAPPLA